MEIRGKAGEEIVNSMEQDCVYEGHDIFFVAAEIPDIQTRKPGAENMNCLGGKNPV